VKTFALAALAFCAVALAPAAGRADDAAAASDAAAAASDAAEVRAPVERLYGGLSDVMKRSGSLDFAGRYQSLEPIVGESFDLPFMAELILGRPFKALAPEQQATWIETFARLTTSTYADRFDSDSGVRFEIDRVEPGAQGTSLVRTRLLRTDGDPVKLDYRMRKAASGWRISDVFLSGTVSELALRRSEYGALMRREGFDALLAAVRKKIAAAEAGTGETP
jgi:phospholipid transport system substrate-binding protein